MGMRLKKLRLQCLILNRIEDCKFNREAKLYRNLTVLEKDKRILDYYNYNGFFAHRFAP